MPHQKPLLSQQDIRQSKACPPFKVHLYNRVLAVQKPVQAHRKCSTEELVERSFLATAKFNLPVPTYKNLSIFKFIPFDILKHILGKILIFKKRDYGTSSGLFFD